MARGGAFLVKRTAGEAFTDMRSLLHLQERRKNLLAGCVQQERGLAILARTADRADEVCGQTARPVGGGGHRDPAGREGTRVEPRPGAVPGPAAAPVDRLQGPRVPR